MIGNKQIIFLHGWGLDKNCFSDLAALLPNHEKILFDLPGFGQTELPKRPWGTSGYSQYIVSRLSPRNKYVFIGYSFGGRIAIKIAASYPELVNKIVLIASAGLRKKFNFKRFFRKIFKINSQDYQNAGALKPILSKIVREDLSQDLKKIKCPALLLWGENDNQTPLWAAKKMAKLLPNNKLVVLLGIDHYNILTLASHQIAHQIKEFLK